MDQIDKNILGLLKKNARLPLKTIAEEVYLSSPAVSSRIEHMEESGLIEGYHAHISPEKMNLHIKAFIQLEIDPVQKAEFYPYIESIPNVIECDCVTGDYSMLLMVYFHTTQELDQFINQLQHFGKTRTQIVFSTPVEHRGISIEAIPVEQRGPGLESAPSKVASGQGAAVKSIEMDLAEEESVLQESETEADA